MGLRGPAKKPTAQEIAEGRPGKAPLNAFEPQVTEGEPDMPGGMSDEAKIVWRETVPLMLTVPGLLTIVDGTVLADFCELRAEYKTQKAACAKEFERTWKKSKKLTRVETKALVEDRYRTALDKLRYRENILRRELGLSPSARSTMRIGGPVKDAQAAEDVALFRSGPRLVRV